MKIQQTKTNNELTVAQHTKELKRRLFFCFFVILVVFALCYINATAITEYLLQLVKKSGFNLVYTSPTEMLIQSLRLCAAVTMIVSLPVIAWQVCAFCMPALETTKAKRTFAFCITIAYTLFICGIAFCKWVLFPVIFRYLYEYSQLFTIDGMATVSSILNLALTTMWTMGIVFEFPLLCAALTHLGLLKSKNMIKAFKPAVVVIAIIAAAITPPDVISMGIVAVPLLLDYLLGICTCKIYEKRHILFSTQESVN